ncbi:MAG: phosphate ABC transporter substrate-binding/OmpA family protein, partial [Fibrobacterota bacterium]
ASVTFTGENKSLNITVGEGIVARPSRFSVKTEDYPLSRRLFLYTPEKLSAPARDLVEYSLSVSGQGIVEQVGFVAQTLRLVKPDIPSTAPSIYRSSVGDALRLSVNFRFVPGSSIPDNRSLRDIDRFADFIEREDLSRGQVKLFGFSDNIGSLRGNRALSHRRARAIAKLLNDKTGLKVSAVRGFGSIMPVASNKTYDGRMKNRRVEVWLDFNSEG